MFPVFAAASVAVASSALPARAATEAQVRILHTEFTPDGRIRVHHSVPEGHYFVLLGGSDPAAVDFPIRIQSSGPDAGVLEATLERTGAAFFLVQAVPETAPLDLDGDRIDDLFELARRPLLDPLNPSDAGLDPDRDGLSNFEEYLRGTDLGTPNALVTTFASSPAAGEADVAVTRETVIEFSSPLSATSTPGTNAIYAEFGGRRLLTRLDVASDRRKASLFYLENLPGSARVRVVVDGDQLQDAGGRAVDADRDGQAGGVARFAFDTVNLTPTRGTVVVGQVLASELAPAAGGAPANQPLAGVTVTVDGREEELRAVTDAEGRFTLSPAPTGTFFVHIDGRTAVGSAWPGGAYYPFVGKAWEAVAGRTNLAGGTGLIYLPLIPSGALQTVSATQPTTVAFAPEVLARNPELDGVQIQVPANALFNDAGVRGGRVGIAPVAPDRLPSPLPPGLDLGLVITVQTDGPQNFDQPVPVRFPNTPDPVTGRKLAPGEKSALWSFNHDTGRWEIVGPMTVTADGRFVETDPGVGLRQPGWHGQRPGTTGNGPPGPPPPDFCDKVAEQALGSSLGCAGGKALAGALKAAGGLTIDAVSSTIPGEGVVAFIVSSAGTYAVREGTFGDPGSSITDALQQEALCCACLAKMGIFGSSGCGGKGNFSLPALAARARALQAVVGVFNPGGSLAGNQDAAAAAHIARLEALTARFITNATRHLELVAQARALVGNAKVDADLPPAVLDQVKAIDAQIKSLLGNQRPADFYRAQLEVMQKTEGELMETLGIDGSGPAHFLLQNLTSGTVLRGRTDARGGLPDLILAPNQNYRITRVDIRTLAVGISEFASAPTGIRTIIPRGFWVTDPLDREDTDADGLTDLAETALGTNPSLADTDGDGISDATEVTADSDPLGGLTLATGVIGSADTPGTAMDVCVQGDLAAVADGPSGVTLFDVSRPQQPVARARVATGTSARALACEPGTVYVADGTAGLTILDTRIPEAATRVRTVGLGSPALAITRVGGLVAVGLEDGRVVLVEPATGRLTAQRSLASRISDLTVDETGVLWAATGNRLVSLRVPPSGALLETLGSAPLSFFPEGITQRRRVSVADGRAYVTSYPGYQVFDVFDPGSPTEVGAAVDRGPNSFKQLVPISPRLGTAAVGINPRDDGTHDVWLYDLAQPSATTNFLAILGTPGIAHALAVHRGRVLVADGAEGLQVVNPLPADTGRTPPTASLATVPAGDEVEEGTRLVLNVLADDDVLVARVEFFADGVLLDDDGAYPFATTTVVPTLTANQTSVRLRARATDTGGNTTWTAERTIRIVKDRTAPVVERVTPSDRTIVGETRELRVQFSEPLAPESIANGLRVWALPPERTVVATEPPPGNPLPGTLIAAGNVLAFRVTDPLPEGRYLAQVETSVRDRSGNPLALPFRWQFLTLAFTDVDADGVPDDLEPSLGLSPASADSNGNGIPDGDEDFDQDGVPNALERVAGFDPRNPRSTGTATLDGSIDTDLDGLRDWREVLLGTLIREPDTDGDFWADGVEVEVNSDPLDEASVPRLFSLPPGAFLIRPAPADPVTGRGQVPVVTAAPLVLSFGLGPDGTTGRTPATPSVASLVLLPGSEGNGTFSGTPFSLPPVQLRLETP